MLDFGSWQNSNNVKFGIILKLGLMLDFGIVLTSGVMLNVGLMLFVERNYWNWLGRPKAK